VGIIDPDGILKACTTKLRMNKANTKAMIIASTYSRNRDFFLGVISVDSAKTHSFQVLLSKLAEFAALLLLHNHAIYKIVSTGNPPAIQGKPPGVKCLKSPTKGPK
jgi:hypothetical protein